MSGMDGAREGARRNAYRKIHHTCACGRQLEGNLAKSHLRACETNLAQNGWPMEEAMHQALRNHYGPLQCSNKRIISKVERGLGGIYLQRRRTGNKQPLTWREYKETVWTLAERAAEETGATQ